MWDSRLLSVAQTGSVRLGRRFLILAASILSVSIRSRTGILYRRNPIMFSIRIWRPCSAFAMKTNGDLQIPGLAPLPTAITLVILWRRTAISGPGLTPRLDLELKITRFSAWQLPHVSLLLITYFVPILPGYSTGQS